MMSLFQPSTNKQIWDFSPQMIPGLNLWLDAADASTISVSPGTTTVTAWNDKSGNGRHAAAVGTDMTYTGTQNGRNAIQGPQGNTSNSAGGFTLPSFAVSTTNEVTFFAVYNQIVTPNGPNNIDAQFISNTSNNSDFNVFSRVQISGTTPLVYFVRVDGDVTSSGGSYSDSTTNVARIYGLSYTSTANSLFVNGTAYTPAISVANATGLNTNRVYTVFSGTMQGNCCEMLIFGSSLTSLDRRKVEGYLAWKWGLQSSLVSGHPYLSPTVKAGPYLKTFSPTDISGCVAWFDASDATTVTMSGANVTNWIDKATAAASKVGGAGGLTVSGTAPTIGSQNGLNTIQFGGSSGLIATNLTSATIPKGNATGTYFVVGRTTSNAASPQMMFAYGNNPTATGRNRQFYFTTNGTQVFTDVNQAARDETSYPNPQYAIISSNQTLATVLTNTSYINGNGFTTNDTTTLAVTANVASVPATSVFSVGCGLSSASFPLTGNIAEILIYSTELSTSERQQIELYLAWKWDLRPNMPSILNTHPFYKFPPAAVTP